MTTVLFCEVSCTVRSPVQQNTHNTMSNSVAEYRENISRLMTAACGRCGAWIRQQNPNAGSAMRPFDDLMIITDFQVLVYKRSEDVATDVLSDAFTKQLVTVDRTHASYYLFVRTSYPEETYTYFLNEDLKSFSLGFMSKADQFHTQFDYQQSIYSYSRQNPRLTLEVDKGEMIIDFAISNHGGRFHKVSHGLSPTTEVYRLSIKFKDLSPHVIVHKAQNNVTLCFLTSTPVQLWRTQFDLPNLSKVHDDKTTWMRTCNVHSTTETAEKAFLNRETIGNCHVLLLRFDADLMARETLPTSVKRILNSLQHISSFVPFYTVLRYSPRSTFEPAPSIQGGTDTGDVNWMLAAVHSIGYRIQYQLQQFDVRDQFMASVHKYTNDSVDNNDKIARIRHLNTALNKTYDILLQDTDRFLSIVKVLDHFLAERMELSEMVIRTQSRMIKRLVVTPSRVVFLAPSLMHDNRILRTFEPNFAVSCSFQNDDMMSLPAVADNIAFIKDSIGDVLRRGVTVANCHYEFLACSGSQLKNHGCWLYARDSLGRTAEYIRNWMGELDHIHNPGKYLARMGQCFSDTTAAELDADIEIEWEDEDVEGGLDPDGNPYCFSDGVGRISEECLKEVFLKGATDQHLPSAFQVRLGGAKGMLSLDKNLTGKCIKVRKSMLKFRSNHRMVEVMKRSQPGSLYLNKQIILILSQLKNGIPDHVFIRFFYNMLHRLADLLLEDDKALVYLSQAAFPCPYAKLHRAGFHFTTDPFFRGVIKAIICARINSLKNKTRIEIPPEHGRNMLGVMDEEGVLEYGEVFVQYSKDVREPNQDPIVLTGDVVVSKMPALHPGDVRKLQAVDKPELRHMVDCIVFPQKGPRPHPNEMAGSDLDGDEYFVTWHPDLIFPGDNEPPMDFPSAKKEELKERIQLHHMIDFIVTSIVNNQIGRISNAHMAWADRDSIYSERCLQLCRIFSHVIDFNKTGYLPDEVKGNKVFELIPTQYPDFMGKQDVKESYASSKILGKLYRIGQRVEQSVMTIDKEDQEKVNTGDNWEIDKRFFVNGHQNFLQLAGKLYELYEGYLGAEQRRYGIVNEEELVSSCVTYTKGLYSRSDEHYDVENRLKDRMQDIRTYIHAKFDEMLKNSQDYDEKLEGKLRRQFAAACYVTTYESKRKYRSFPWLFAEDLVNILKRTEQSGPDTPMAQLTESIQELDIADAERTFRRYSLDIPPDNGLTKLYHILINWGQKSKFLPQGDANPSHSQMQISQFAMIIDKVMEVDEDLSDHLDDEEGPLLCRLLRALTGLPDDVELAHDVPVPQQALVTMKRQILLAHHHLARDRRATCLLVRQTKISRNIQVHRHKWPRMRDHTEKIAKDLKTRFNIRVEFRAAKRQRGNLFISGWENDVFDFNEFWHDDFKIEDYISEEEEEEEESDSDEDFYLPF